MRRHFRLVTVLLGVVLLLPASHVNAADERSTVEQLRKELMQLPYYGVFDFLMFKYDKGTVTLMGYAYRPTLKTDATRAAKRVPAVDSVVDKIEELPVSQADDEIRWAAYYKIYRDPFLSRYAPGGGALWGHRHPFGPGFHPLGPAQFPGMEPIGDHPIHIVVKGGRIMLFGVVDNASDKQVAEIRAREVPGAFGVENYLVVDTNEKKSDQ